MFKHYSTDRQYTFTRGADTVHVTIDGRTVRNTKARLILAIVPLVALAAFCALLPILLPLPIIGIIVVLGQISAIDETMRLKAEAIANTQFDVIDRNRWAALGSLRNL